MLQRLFNRLLGQSGTPSTQSNLGRIDRRQIFDYAFEFAAKSGLDGCYAEFGCFDGTSFVRAWQARENWLNKSRSRNWQLSNRQMYAFDSFRGLPELERQDQMHDYSIFDAGQYACSEDEFVARIRERGVDTDYVTTIRGFYSDTLRSELIEQHGVPPAVVIHIDCDLYSSARDVLEFASLLVQDGTLLLFDDYFCYRGNPRYGVRKAFDEWIAANRTIGTTHYCNYGWAGAAFILNVDGERQ